MDPPGEVIPRHPGRVRVLGEDRRFFGDEAVLRVGGVFEGFFGLEKERGLTIDPWMLSPPSISLSHRRVFWRRGEGARR